jgi:hypothetical protein
MWSGQGSSDGKRALYHCNYCNKDITGKTRIKCAVCPDFDLCLECFSVGAEVTPHKSNHPYRVMVSASPSNNLPTCYFAWFCSLFLFNLALSLSLYQHGNLTGLFDEIFRKFWLSCCISI